MHGQGFFFQAFVYLTAAVVTVPVAKRLGLGSVLGYLIAGMVIGPAGLGLIGEEGQDVMHFAEFGVVMMLFVVGLELEPALLWRLRVPILGMGGLQVAATTAAFLGIALGLGYRWQEALAIGLILALSSTAIVLQTFNEKGLMGTAAGKSGFAVLLFQDIAVIPMLALLPLLATHGAGGEGDGHHGGWIETLPGWLQTVVVLAAVAAIVLGGRFALRPAFRTIAKTNLRELFVASVLLLVIGIALLMSTVGLSPALGTFVAGVVLADSEYRHELESDIEPFKGLLLGLFFIAVGASVDFPLIQAQPATIFGMVGVLVVVKFVVLIVVARVFRMSTDQSLLVAFAMAQGGEFGFVLFSFASTAGVLTPAQTAPLVASVAVSMALTPLLLLVFERLVQPRVGTVEADRDFDEPEAQSVIIAGYGRFGQICTRLLHAQGYATTVLEFDSDQVDLLRKFGRKVFYGDATRHDLLESAGAGHAKLLILAIDQPEKVLEMVHTAKKHFPQLAIMARARGRDDAYRLVAAGADHVYRETFDSALRLGTDALRRLGVRAHRAHRAAQRFRRHDEKLMWELVGEEDAMDDMFRLMKRHQQQLEQVMKADLDDETWRGEDGWDSAALRTMAAPKEDGR